MCLAVLALNAHPDWPLILVGNRDEFHARPTAPLHPWPDHSILGGRDLEAGGSWMGLGNNHRFVLVTNHRDLRRPVPEGALSRGRLVTDFIESPLDAQAFCHSLPDERFASFNLLLRDSSGWYHYSNLTRHCRPLGTGVYGLSNALLDTPWPKTLLARQRLQQQLAQGLPQPERLIHLLHDQRRPLDSRLPDTGLSLERERLLSSCMILSDDYGTRASSLILQHRSGRLLFMEEGYSAEGRCQSRRRYQMQRPLLA
ncbi:NRDE family protein [Marinobacterium sp. AK62]|uniref:NRDE family protein n=1 Tax=Marinobacterium alkalitolerans TaxID=1542925 RepID=A0ABS3ZEA4_9GAMM|nr:NRDE family protein [Marinobacterium alkalitolerans]MBP0050036.1 NRDE family protein [Marinobacterium alkalitolerans]